ncbi:unnamed protein product [Parnassius apollo]|uniref:Regulatory protein zeste n=1 Tax=Parnassius apollo TaxID=110799 RepID=A0A8S3W8F6_PARAO|nr:unnamed protein product [Parnassius apollo]
MNPIERASHPSRAQISTLLDFFKKHPSLSKGFSRVPSARDAARKMWEKITLQLNSLEGCVKSTKQWIKYWADKKSAVKKKAALRFRAKNKTGGRAEVVELTDLEERILTLMGGESFAIGNRQIEINPFENTNQDRLDSHTDSSPSLLAKQLSIGLDAATPNTTEQDSSTNVVLTASDIINIPTIETPQQPRLECVPGTSHLSSSSSEVHIVYFQEQDSSTNVVLKEGDIINIPTIETSQQPRLECVPVTSHLSSSSSEVHIVSQCPMSRAHAVPSTPPRVGSPVSSMPTKPSGSGRHPQQGHYSECSVHRIYTKMEGNTSHKENLDPVTPMQDPVISTNPVVIKKRAEMFLA